jgi:hypothetical protein
VLEPLQASKRQASGFNISSFKPSSLQILGSQVVKYQISQGIKHVHNPRTQDSLAASFITTRSLLEAISLVPILSIYKKRKRKRYIYRLPPIAVDGLGNASASTDSHSGACFGFPQFNCRLFLL